MQKRISALLLAMVIVIGSVLGGNTLKVKAASVAVSEEFAVELTMMLYNLLETVAQRMIVIQSSPVCTQPHTALRISENASD